MTDEIRIEVDTSVSELIVTDPDGHETRVRASPGVPPTVFINVPPPMKVP